MTDRKPMTPDELRQLARRAAETYQNAERELCDLLSAIDQARLWSHWGYSSLAHYAENELGLGHRKALELVRVSMSLRALPELERAFREDGVPFSKIREATRVATPGTDADWAQTVRDKPCREVERAVFAQRRAETITLKLELTAEEHDRFERAVEAVRRRRGRGTSLADCLDEMAASLLACGAPAGDGSSRYPDGSYTAPFVQVIHRCDACERAEVQTRRGAAQVSEEMLAQAACDSTVIRDGRRARREIPRAVARAVWARARGRCESCGQRGWLHLHHRVAVEDGGRHAADNLALLCSACHRGEHRGGHREAPAGVGIERASGERTGGERDVGAQVSEPETAWGRDTGLVHESAKARAARAPAHVGIGRAWRAEGRSRTHGGMSEPGATTAEAVPTGV